MPMYQTDWQASTRTDTTIVKLQSDSHEISFGEEAEAGGRLSANLTPCRRQIYVQQNANIKQSQKCSHRCKNLKNFHNDTIISRCSHRHNNLKAFHTDTAISTQPRPASKRFTGHLNCDNKLSPAGGSAPPTHLDNHTRISNIFAELQKLENALLDIIISSMFTETYQSFRSPQKDNELEHVYKDITTSRIFRKTRPSPKMFTPSCTAVHMIPSLRQQGETDREVSHRHTL